MPRGGARAAPKGKPGSSRAAPKVEPRKATVDEDEVKLRKAREAEELASDWFRKDAEEQSEEVSSESEDESGDDVEGSKLATGFSELDEVDESSETASSDFDDDDDEDGDDEEDVDDEDDEEDPSDSSSTSDVAPKSKSASSSSKSTSLVSKKKNQSENEQAKTVREQRELEGEFASSDEEYERNAAGDVPLEWYTKTFDHIGYDRAGEKILPKGDGDAVSRALLYRGESEASKEFRRSVYDARNDEVTVLTDRELLMVKRMLEGKFPHPELDAEPEYIPYYSGVPMKTSLNAAYEPKRRFIPSKWERMKVERIARGIQEGKIKIRTEEEELALREEEEKPKLYMLWGEDGDVQDKDEMMRRRRRTGGHVPAPKIALPGHKESYHPPPEYLPTPEERAELEKNNEFVPQDIVPMRRVGAYSSLVREEFERCLDLYLCARTTKVKLNIDPESLVPRLPLPRELRPFPTTNAIQFLGHSGKVRSVSCDPNGELMATGGDDGDVRVWDVQSGRCLSVFRLAHKDQSEEADVSVVRLAWNPRIRGVVAAACGSEIHICFASVALAHTSESLLAKTLETLGGLDVEDDRAEEEKEHEKKLVSWSTRAEIKSVEDLGEGSVSSIVVIQLTGGDRVIDLSWHSRGDFLCSVAASSTKTVGRVLVHHVPKRRSQEAMKRLKGDPQAAVFHPDKPVLFVATKTHIVAHHLTKQSTIKRLRAGVRWISSLAVHPKGDHLVIGSYDCRVVWFDLDLSSKPFKVMKYHTKAVRRVCFHRKYPLMASASDDGTINIFHTTVYDDYTRNPLIVPVKRIEAHDVVAGRGVLDAIFHPLQPWIITSGADSLSVLFTNIP